MLIYNLNLDIDDIEIFNKKMVNNGYDDISKSFLNKAFGDITVNITIRDSKVETITAYKNNEITSIPEEILQTVKDDIKKSL